MATVMEATPTVIKMQMVVLVVAVVLVFCREEEVDFLEVIRLGVGLVGGSPVVVVLIIQELIKKI